MKRRVPFFLFLAFYLFFSLGTYRDYGCTWDEQDTYQGGNELYQFILHGVKPSYFDPEHSYPYTFLLSFISSKTDYEFLHLLNLLFAALLFWAVFEVLMARTEKPWPALAGPVFLFLYPPFTGSIPANPKDVPFAIFYFLSLAAIYLFEKKKPGFKARWAILGVLFAFGISSRIVGFTLFPILVLFDGFAFWALKKKRGPEELEKWLRRKSLDWGGVLVTSQVLCLVLWPYLGENYFKHLINVLWLSAHFPPKFAFLFMGGMADSLTYPWYCLPLWIGITTPLFILAFFAAAIVRVKDAASNGLYFLLASALLVNLGLYLWLHPAIYDGLRHFLFLLPILSTLAALAFIEFFRQIKRQGTGTPRGSSKAGTGKIPYKIHPVKMTVGLLAFLSAGITAAHMIRLHPYEYTYFNEFVGGFKGAYGKYETDYWVASMKEAVEWLKSNEMKDPNRFYKIFVEGHPPQYKIYFNPHMLYVPSAKEADYSIVMTRAGIKPAPEDEGRIIHRVEREGAPLCFILKLR